MQHFPEPWIVQGNGEEGLDLQSAGVAIIATSGRFQSYKRAADFDRIAACVAACTGVENADLSPNVVTEMRALLLEVAGSPHTRPRSRLDTLRRIDQLLGEPNADPRTRLDTLQRIDQLLDGTVDADRL